ncbi:hypothetical protein OG607_16905 [Streptomyces sp. NBC_01537]|uniref:hypothetical protein n=1 Tax=Streptomyces sp. NBC_01537 TaxID=2903896 RepID=UPI00387079FB
MTEFGFNDGNGPFDDELDRALRDELGGGFDDEPFDFEAKLREMLTEDAGSVAPGQAPYSAIVRRGQAAQRRRAAAMGIGLATLVALPGAAYAVNVQWSPDPGVSARPGASSKSPATSPAPTTPAKPTPVPSGAAGPATPGQLADGITLERASEALTACLDYNKAHRIQGSPMNQDLGKAADYRIILALRTTGDDNAPGDGIGVVAVKDTPKTRLICSEKGGVGSGLNTSIGEDNDPNRGAVAPDINASKLYKQTILSSGSWKLPYRWGSIGTIESGVARVTVSYGGATVEAALDHGYFAATGILTQSVSRTPHIKGYDADGKLVYDSDSDTGYDQAVS